MLKTNMGLFMLQLEIEPRQVNGPFVNYLPPKNPGEPERVVYTANIVYNRKDKLPL